MNLGDGLTFHSQTIGGKTTSGIFLTSNSQEKAPNFQSKLKTRNSKNSTNPKNSTKLSKLHKHADDKVTKGKSDKRNAKINHQIGDSIKQSESNSNDVLFIDNNKKVDGEEKKETKAQLGQSNQNKSKSSVEKGLRKVPGRSIPSKANNSSSSNIKRTSNEEKTKSKEIKVDTTFVTLTQDQLNTILNLVKTKQDIDLAGALKKNTNEASSEAEETATTNKPVSSEELKVEPTFVPGLDLDDKESNNTESDKENGKTENVKNLLKKSKGGKETSNTKFNSQRKGRVTSASSDKDNTESEVVEKRSKTLSELSGTLGGYGSRDRDKSRLEERRKQWIEDLNEQVERKKQLESRMKIATKSVKSSSSVEVSSKGEKQQTVVERPQRNSAPSSAAQAKRNDENALSSSSAMVQQIHESLPTAIRSSFFLGEAVPRDHAFSAKKKQRQQAWKEDLEKQIKEKDKKKLKQATAHESVDTNAWERHFDTMNPPPSKPSQNVPISDEGNGSASHKNVPETTSLPSEASQNLTPRNATSDNIAGIYSGDHSSNAPGGRAQSNYLRTMTALLDPSQIDALELKRQKQLEHRRIIAEQVEERRRIKEEESRAKREEEEQEERRLAEERRKIKNQFEKEKNKQHAMEEKRDRQTQELYQQMKEAQATALKEKFEKRQHNLRSHGHDTSRLERTHKNVLEKSLRPIHSPTHTSPVPALNMNDLHMPNQYAVQQNQQLLISPRTSVNYQQTDQSPISVVANTGQGAIKLEISLNQKQAGHELVATGIQTDKILTKPKKTKTSNKKDSFLEILSDSDAETEYMALPYPSSRRVAAEKQYKRKPNNKNDTADNARHYDRYSRANRKQTDSNAERPQDKGEKPKWGVGKKKKQYKPASDRYVNSQRWKQERDDRLKRREEELLTQQILNQPDRLLADRNHKSDTDISSAPNPASYQHYPHNRRDRSKSPVKAAEVTARNPKKGNHLRSSSPPVPAVMNQMKGDRYEHAMTYNRPDTAMSVTTDQAKYKSTKHSPNSPVPDTDDFVEYRRSDVILDPNRPETREERRVEESSYQHQQEKSNTSASAQEQSKDPLINSDLVKQRERQDKILKEISILRQGLLLKQREVASYPVAVTMANIGKNLPERTNDVNIT